MQGFALAHDLGPWGMVAFLPVGLILLVGILLVLGPAFTGTSDSEQPEDSHEEDRR
ncbi:MAG TPA: hypothetical protein VFD04_23285 [Actinomycetes bacterium]|jgi:hypothetical protein|nr:hypothetical protein [Actinomycetes bacterium]